jgi:menaquinone-dependent protoporphyrinogen IX oxidase
MKALVVYYSRTGVTRKLGQALAQALGAEVEELTDLKSRRGPLGFLRGGIDAARKRLTALGPVSKAPGEYDLVVLGTPVWAGTMAPALRTYLTTYRESLRRVAFFCTQGGTSEGKTFLHLGELVGRKPAAVLSCRTKDVKAGACDAPVREFAARLTAAS